MTTMLPACVDPALLQSRLQERLRGRVRDLHVQVHERGMVLRGFAACYHAKQMAQHYAMAEASLPIVANDIEVLRTR